MVSKFTTISNSLKKLLIFGLQIINNIYLKNHICNVGLSIIFILSTPVLLYPVMPVTAGLGLKWVKIIYTFTLCTITTTG